MSTAQARLLAKRLKAAAKAAQAIESARASSEVVAAKDGDRGPKGDKPDHEWSGTALRFEKPDGSWGESVDLRGPKGARGDRGPSGGGGGAGVDRPPISPSFTYVDGVLTGVAYADGSTKTLTWAAGRLSRLDFLRPARPSVRKDFSYNGDGTLAAVAQSSF